MNLHIAHTYLEDAARRAGRQLLGQGGQPVHQNEALADMLQAGLQSRQRLQERPERPQRRVQSPQRHLVVDGLLAVSTAIC